MECPFLWIKNVDSRYGFISDRIVLLFPCVRDRSRYDQIFESVTGDVDKFHVEKATNVNQAVVVFVDDLEREICDFEDAITSYGDVDDGGGIHVAPNFDLSLVPLLRGNTTLCWPELVSANNLTCR